MPRGISNWTFRDVQSFLVEHGFILHHIRGSHHYFKGFKGGKFYMTSVQHHGSKAIPDGTLAAIIRQSGIPKDEWLNA